MKAKAFMSTHQNRQYFFKKMVTQWSDGDHRPPEQHQ